MTIGYARYERAEMNEKPLRLGKVFGSMVLGLVLAAGPLLADDGGTQRHGRGTHMKVSGVVSKVHKGQIMVKTSWGQLRISSGSAPKNLEVGEDVVMQVNENNTVIDVHRKGEQAHAHRFITGNLVYVGKMKKEIKLWTPEGEKVFPLDRLEIKTGGIAEGTLVTVELNEAGHVIDLHRFTVELAFDEYPRTNPGHVLQVDGTVTKFDSALVYVKTPAGQYTLMRKYAPADAAVGDRVTLWLNEEGMVIDVHGKEKHKAGPHRLIFGNLVYAGKTKDQIKLQTPEGEQVFPLQRMEVKTKPIAEGSDIAVELNEGGTVIDLRKVQ